MSMVNTTATQNIRKPQSTDDPKLLAAYFEQTATDIDLRMAAHFADLARVTDPPFAVLRLNTGVNVETGFVDGAAPVVGAIPFDTVDMDTAGMVDLSASQFTITLNQTGYYWVGGYARISGFLPSADSDPRVSVRSSSGGTHSDSGHDVSGHNPGFGISGWTSVSSLATPTTLSLTVSNNGSGTTTVTFVYQAELWAVKVRDL
jgi:hypothetical protein